MRLRKLRIAWSIFWGLAAVLLIALWVRSYWWHDSFQWQLAESRPLYIRSDAGSCSLFTGYDLASDRNPPGFWRLNHGHIDHEITQWSWFSFYYDFYWDNLYLTMRAPHWFFALASGAFAAAPWLRWRFSLRTLLIAMTAIAVVLGSIMWLR